VQKNQVGLKLNATFKILAYARDVNLLGDNIHTIRNSTETFTDDRKELCLLNIQFIITILTREGGREGKRKKYE
jgi:hypothetical protein